MNQEDLASIAAQTKQADNRYDHIIKVCVAAGCLSANAEQVKTRSRARSSSAAWNRCQVKGVGCMGLCAAGPAGLRRARRERHVSEREARTMLPPSSRQCWTTSQRQTPALCSTASCTSSQRQKKSCWKTRGKIDPERSTNTSPATATRRSSTSLTRHEAARR